MGWLLSNCMIRLNYRDKSLGRVFSERYKPLIVDGSGKAYRKTVCDYVHLNPARAELLKPEDRLLAHPWSSSVWFMAARQHWPGWVRADQFTRATSMNRRGAKAISSVTYPAD
jgi:hypothetical protein